MEPQVYTITQEASGDWSVTLDGRVVFMPFADREDADLLLAALNEAYQLGSSAAAKSLAEELFRS